jgi:hypothetical protein
LLKLIIKNKWFGILLYIKSQKKPELKVSAFLYIKSQKKAGTNGSGVSICKITKKNTPELSV